MSYAIIRQAIINRQQVSLLYHRHLREVCPHAIGTKNGVEHVLTYQFGGKSNSGLPPQGEWRCMNIGEISEAVAREGDWHSGDAAAKPQNCFDHLDVEVSH